jgi:hypothetical protein
MAQQFEQPINSSELRTQRMTADESRAVIDLWQQERVEQTGLTDKPAVPDVAEGLDITIEDVQRLLQDVRAKRLEEERALASEQALSEIRSTEEERKLSEIRRQRAELRREQAEAERRAAEQRALLSSVPRSWQEEPNEILLGFLPGFVAIAFVVGMALLLTALSQPQPIR